MPEAGDLLALMPAPTVRCFSFRCERCTGWVAMSVWTATAIASPPEFGSRHILGPDQAREVVAALAALLLGVGQPEEAELAHAREDQAVETCSSPTPRRAERAHSRRSWRSTPAAPVLFGETRSAGAWSEVWALGRFLRWHEVDSNAFTYAASGITRFACARGDCLDLGCWCCVPPRRRRCQEGFVGLLRRRRILRRRRYRSSQFAKQARSGRERAPAARVVARCEAFAGS